MNRVLLFFVSFALFLGAVWIIEGRIPDQDPFEETEKYQIFSLDGFAESEISRLKLRHAEQRSKPYDLGLFGNSRILSVSKKNLNLGACSVYNFALLGQSIRSSAIIIERLANLGVLPKVSIISTDHFELQMSNNPAWLEIISRWGYAIEDFKLVLSKDKITVLNRMRVVWRVLWTEALAFQQRFELKFIRRGLLQLLNTNSYNFPIATKREVGYRKDGSIRDIFRGNYFPPLSPQKPQVINALFHNDLERIASVRRRTKNIVIIYESPLHPESGKKFLKSPSTHAVKNRKILFDVCTTHNLECHLAPIEIFSDTKGWRDVSHPPAVTLGRWISGLAAPKLGYCRS